ncbi:lipopolysaccharide biosynthesis protein [Acinetobacter indicus]
MIEVVSKGINWITLPLLALVATAGLYGEVAYYYLIIVLTGTLFAFGQNRVILSSQNNEVETKKNISILISFFLVIVVEALIYFLGYFELKLFFAILCGCFFAIQNNLSLTFRAQNRVNDFALLKTYYVVRIITIFLVVYFTRSIEWYLFFELLILIVYFMAFSKFKFVKNDFNVITSLKDGLILVMYAISMYLITNIDKFYIEHLFSKEVLASYYFLFSLSTSFTFISAYFSIRYERDIYNSPNYTVARLRAGEFAKKTILLSILIFPFIFLFYYFYVGFTSLDYKPYWFIMVFIAQLIYFVSIKETYVLTYLKKNKIIFYCSFFVLFFSVILNYILIKFIGVLGSILTLIFCYTIFGLGMAFFNSKNLILDK